MPLCMVAQAPTPTSGLRRAIQAVQAEKVKRESESFPAQGHIPIRPFT